MLLLAVPTPRSTPPRRRGLPPGTRRCGALLACLLAAIAAPASGQSSRAEVIAQQEAAKAKKLAPFKPNKAEALGQDRGHPANPSGLYPFFGSVERRRLHARRRLPAVHRRQHLLRHQGPTSFSNYKYIETTAATLGLAGGKVNLGAHLGWRDATQVAYYGVGIDTPPEDRSNYRFKQGWVSGDIVARPAWWTVFGANIGYEDFSLESGSGTASPSIEEIFTPDTAPGLGLSPTYLRSSFGGIDTRPSPGYARRGTFIEARYHNYADQDDA